LGIARQQLSATRILGLVLLALGVFFVVRR
jgi:hypothetical protein